ncbi:hypothetical protein [Spongiimicrobium salis]|uniref:hypothetical protein n=1 Tax=Spongiimicrobium salis TaxID=1667022 RepID=UPI00374CE76C
MRKYAPLLLLFVFLNSCSGESEVNLIDPDLDGQWTLTEAFCFCFFPDDFNFAVHQLLINVEENQVTVSDNPNSFFLIAPGTYTLSGERAVLTFNGAIQYQYRIDGDRLELTKVDDPNISDDELTLVYVRGGGFGTSF